MPVPLPVHLCQTVLHSTFDEFVFTLSFFSSFFFLFSSAPRSLYTDTITACPLILCGILRRYLLRPV
jgi:hypothetical protein